MRRAKVLRYSLDRYLEQDAEAPAQDLAALVRRTADERTRFEAVVASGAFALAYQPVVSLKDRSLHHFEALARFSPGASPDLTIRFAEELDLIRELDLAVAAAAVGALARSPAETRIAVNVSALSLMTPGFVDAFEAVAAPIAPDRMMVEVTETQGLGDLDRASAIIAELRSGGRSVCLDDFGAGAATLEYLRRLDVDYVKIDGRYVRDAGEVSRDAVVLKHMVALCHELGVATIAEMAETPSALALLETLDVDLVQGFAFGRPTPEPVWS